MTVGAETHCWAYLDTLFFFNHRGRDQGVGLPPRLFQKSQHLCHLVLTSQHMAATSHAHFHFPNVWWKVGHMRSRNGCGFQFSVSAVQEGMGEGVWHEC